MNKHRFRLIFSKSLGFLIPVAETTRAQRKPGQTSCSVASSTSPFFSLKRLAASLLLAGLPGWAFAQLIVDPSAGDTNVISAPNGVPVIEIANPNGKGLSHNRFTEFDVSKPGVIFNNSQSNGVSQLGGALLRNPNLQRQATAILSEVTGNKPSSISGTLEVFGGRADILIANGMNRKQALINLAAKRKPYYNLIYPDSQQKTTDKQNPNSGTSLQTSLDNTHTAERKNTGGQTTHIDDIAPLPATSPAKSDARNPADVNRPAYPDLAARDNSHVDTEHPAFPLSPHLSDDAGALDQPSHRDTPPVLEAEGHRVTDTPMDTDEPPPDTPPLLAKQNRPDEPDSPKSPTPEVIDVNAMAIDLAGSAPRIKAESEASTEPEPTAQSVADTHQEPAATDTPVKEEAPTLQHTINNAAPVLQNENGEDVLREVLQSESKLKKPADLKTLVDRLNPKFPVQFEEDMLTTLARQGSYQPVQDVWKTRADITRAAKDQLNLSAQERAAYMEGLMSVVQTPEKGRGVVANRDIKAFEVLGAYAGKWLDSDGQDREKTKVGESRVNSYAFNVPNKNAIISAFGEGHGNLTTLFNDADSPSANNVGHMWLGKNLVFLVAKRPIPQGEQLLLNYGGDYDRSGWESNPIKVEPEEPTAP